MEELITQLQSELNQLKEWFFNHTHRDYDMSKKLPAGAVPGGSDTDIQFNDGGSFGGDANLQWTKGADGGFDQNIGHFNVFAGTKSNGVGADVIISAGVGTGSNNGGNLTINANDSGASGGIGGEVDILGGNGFTPGRVKIVAGSQKNTTGDGAEIVFIPGEGAGSNAFKEGDWQFIRNANTRRPARMAHIVPTNNYGSAKITGFATTTNATPFTIPANAGVIPFDSSGTVRMIEAKITAFRTGGSAGTAGDSGFGC